MRTKQDRAVGIEFVVERFILFLRRHWDPSCPGLSHQTDKHRHSARGGGTERPVIRMLSPLATEYFGQPWVVRIRTGGAGHRVERGGPVAPDGYTLLSGHANCNTVLPAVEGRGKGPGDIDAVAG